ncbi:hypothetical protein MKK65_22220 [Methylobacterium sp. J-001]|uniref:hypothetical protein n=1 Tax=Methylobacterium sp. J-001 TaxID=2836609 RepID=UPI001FB98CE2|nr:hypothetical protein [Methylobacterium sp. J-001]MCJ2119252.1 hypothetical protein [Methylobacterium sp. J-001]
MLDEVDIRYEIVVQRLMGHLQSHARELNLNDGLVRHIVSRVIRDMPLCPDDERVSEARQWMAIAATM